MMQQLAPSGTTNLKIKKFTLTEMNDRRKNNSNRKVFSKSLLHSFFDQIEIKSGNINQYKVLRRFDKLLKQMIPDMTISKPLIDQKMIPLLSIELSILY
jgi:hypothetical protein